MRKLIDWFSSSTPKGENVMNEVFESRFGFHPCSYETYRKLKLISKYWYVTQRRLAAWERWERKLPHNRVIREYLRNDQGQKIGSRVVGPAPEPQVCSHYGAGHPWEAPVVWLAAYQQARMPVKSKQEVKPLRFSEDKINEKYEHVRQWYEK